MFRAVYENVSFVLLWVPQALFHLVTDLASKFTIHSKYSLEILAQYNNVNTICAHPVANAPVLLPSSASFAADTLLQASSKKVRRTLQHDFPCRNCTP